MRSRGRKKEGGRVDVDRAERKLRDRGVSSCGTTPPWPASMSSDLAQVGVLPARRLTADRDSSRAADTSTQPSDRDRASWGQHHLPSPSACCPTRGRPTLSGSTPGPCLLWRGMGRSLEPTDRLRGKQATMCSPSRYPRLLAGCPCSASALRSNCRSAPLA